MVQCHCGQCRKLSGTGHASQAFFRKQDLSIDGEPARFTFAADSGNTKTYHFCRVCGSRLHGTNSGRPGILIVPVGCFDDSRWFAPDTVAYTACRETWDVTTEAVPNFESMPPLPKPADN